MQYPYTLNICRRILHGPLFHAWLHTANNTSTSETCVCLCQMTPTPTYMQEA